MGLSGISVARIYSTQLTQSDLCTSESQSNEPCNLKQVQNSLRNVCDMRKKSENTGVKQKIDMSLFTLQQNCDFLKTVSVHNPEIFGFLYQPRQISNKGEFCCTGINPTTLAIDMIYGFNSYSYDKEMFKNALDFMVKIPKSTF